MTQTFLGQINSGKLTLDKCPKFREYLHTLEGKRIQLTVEWMKRTRTSNQNRYYWSVVVGEIAKHTGHDPEQIHELLKQKFSPKWHWNTPATTTPTLSVPTSTARLDTIAFVE